MDKKRIFVIIGFTLFCIILGILIYRVFFASEKAPKFIEQDITQTDDTNTFPNGLDGNDRNIVDNNTGSLSDIDILERELNELDNFQIPTPQIQRIVEDNVIGSNTDDAGKLRFYNETDGKFYKIGVNGTPEQISNEVFFNVENVNWSPKSNESIIEYPDGANIYYNFDTKKQVTLPKHWQDFTFSPEGDKIGSKSIGLSPENRWLITSDPEGKNISLIEPLGENADKVTVDWSPNNQIVALSKTGAPLGGERQEILLVGLNDENFKSLVVEGRGFESKWSKKGDKLLYSVFSSRNNFKPELWIVGAQGNNIGAERKKLNLDTWSEKCSFKDDRTIFCAVPRDLQKGAGFAPDLAKSTEDDIFKVDIETGIKSKVEIDGFHVVKEMFVGENGKSLYFTDNLRSGLFEIPI